MQEDSPPRQLLTATAGIETGGTAGGVGRQDDV